MITQSNKIKIQNYIDNINKYGSIVYVKDDEINLKVDNIEDYNIYIKSLIQFIEELSIQYTKIFNKQIDIKNIIDKIQDEFNYFNDIINTWRNTLLIFLTHMLFL